MIQSRPLIQQTLLETIYIIDWCLIDLLLHVHHASHFIIDQIKIWAIRGP